jgi:hypothetical protein
VALALILVSGAMLLVLAGLGRVPDEPACRWAWHIRWLYHAPPFLPATFCAVLRGFYTMLGGLCAVGAFLAAKQAVIQARD